MKLININQLYIILNKVEEDLDYETETMTKKCVQTPINKENVAAISMIFGKKCAKTARF